MNPDEPDSESSFLGRGWSFPPEFSLEAQGVLMSSDEDDVAQSLRILFGTMAGERFLRPDFGLDMQEVQFEPVSVTLRTYLKDRIRIALLVHEPRINLLDLDVAAPDPVDGSLHIRVDYEIRGTNSRFNLVFPFYLNDSNEHRARLKGQSQASGGD